MITPQRYERLRQLFAATCELQPKQRAAVLDQQCPDDLELRSDVQALLAKHEDPTSFLESPVLGADFTLQAGVTKLDRDAALVGQHISHYHLKRVIATGGMGTVYEAVQDKPHRTVAVKVMKQGIASKSALRRFEFESQILARLRHPGIAQVHEAGTYEDGSTSGGGGVPYFVMEYIPNARPITEYAKDQKLSTRRRLELFTKVCDAVHHGHQKGIIHRDLKPPNILVDSSGQPKIIDFGVARATDSDMAITTLQTNVGQLIGTLQYMSPEQCAADPHDLDTRSDVYALGVVLYELLCEQLPYDVSHAPVHEAARMVREEHPTKPSTINRTLRGDVETIVLKALQKQRDRRYQSAAEIAQDIQRYLNHEPIVARPPSLPYQLRMFARRNKPVVGALAAIFVVLVVAAVVSLTFAIREAREAEARRIAEQAALTARDDAVQRQAEAETVTQLLQEILSSADPNQVKGPDYTVRQLLDEFAAGLADQLADQPAIEAAIRATIGNAYHSLGEYDQAEAHLTQALGIRERLLGQEHPSTLSSMNNLAMLYDNQGRYDEAELLYVETLDIEKRVLGEEHPETLRSLSSLAVLYRNQGRYDEAEPLHRKALETLRRVVGQEHPETLRSMNGLAILYWNQGRYDEAEPLFLETLEIRKRVLGDEHPHTLGTTISLALLYWNQGRYDEAEPLYLETLEIEKRVLGEEHPDTLGSMNNLALLYQDQGRYEEAEPLYLQTLDIQKRVLDEEHPSTLNTMNNLAILYKNQGRYEDAEPLYLQTLDIQKRVLGEEHPSTLNTMNNLALLYNDQGRYEEAEPLYLKTLEIRKRVLGEEHPETLTSTMNLAALYSNRGRFKEALSLEAQAVTASRRVWPEGSWYIGAFLGNYGSTLIKLQRYEDAELALVEAHERLSSALGPDHERTIEQIESLVDLYDAWGQPDKAAEWRAKLPEPTEASEGD